MGTPASRRLSRERLAPVPGRRRGRRLFGRRDGGVPLLLVLLLFACNRTPEKPHVILISIDTLRSDHLPAYGYRGVATPAIDGLAADGIVYEHAFSHVPLTLPAHASIFTGLLPAHHGVRDNAAFRLGEKTPTIATMLRSHGYATGGVVSAYVLRSATNISRGFDAYDDAIETIEGAPTGNLARPGRAAIDNAKWWIGALRPEQPFFAFVHIFEPHAPYEPSYDGEIAASDALVGELLGSLRAKKLYDDALIILLSDHGEGLRDHGEQEHGVLLYREVLQVPLIVKLPRNARRGTRVREAVQLVDVLPTIAAVTGVTPPRHDGRSLLEPSSRPIQSETLYPRLHLGWSELRSIIEWPHHLIEGPKPELYDVARDPRETSDIRDSDRRTFAKLRRDVAAATPPAWQRRIDPEEEKKLAALGYVSAQAPSTQASNKNPREHLADLDALKQVTELMSSRRFAEAATLIERLLASNPGWTDLRDQLGVAYEETGDLARAEQTYRDAIRTTPELAPEFALPLANVLLQRGAIDDAEAHAKLASPEAAHEMFARIAVARGDFVTARHEAKLAKSDFLLAQIFLAQNEPQAALVALQRIYSKKKGLPRGYFSVAGEVFLRLGRKEEARLAFMQAVQLHPGDRRSRERLDSLR